jgi:hypothetical protein
MFFAVPAGCRGVSTELVEAQGSDVTSQSGIRDVLRRPNNTAEEQKDRNAQEKATVILGKVWTE